jgi:polyisoprenoid-binding protein YceI
MSIRNISKIALCCLLVAGFAGGAVAADKYAIDGSHSSIGFGIRHMVISTVKGQFNKYEGIIHVDKDITKSSVEVTIETASANTQNEDRDEHLKSPDFFNVAEYPEITFKSDRIEKTKDGLVAVGKLTMHGVTKEIKLPFEMTEVITDPWGNERFGIEATLKLNRKDYGLTWSKKMDNGGLVVGDEVKIEILLEAVKMKKQAG